MSFPVNLSSADVERATEGGQERFKFNTTQGAEAYFGDSVEAHIEGCLGELAFSYGLGVEWDPRVGERDKEDGDVAGWHIRATHHPSGHLRLYDTDDDEAPFALVVGVPPTLTVVGGMRAKYGKLAEWRREEFPSKNGPPYFAPQSALHPFPSANYLREFHRDRIAG